MTVGQKQKSGPACLLAALKATHTHTHAQKVTVDPPEAESADWFWLVKTRHLTHV